MNLGKSIETKEIQGIKIFKDLIILFFDFRQEASNTTVVVTSMFKNSMQISLRSVLWIQEQILLDDQVLGTFLIDKFLFDNQFHRCRPQYRNNEYYKHLSITRDFSLFLMIYKMTYISQMPQSWLLHAEVQAEKMFYCSFSISCLYTLS